MSKGLEAYSKAQKEFAKLSDIATINNIMDKVWKVIINLQQGNAIDAPVGTTGNGFITLGGDELTAYQVRLSGYKFRMGDMIGDLSVRAKFLEAYIEDYKARNWIRVSNEILEREGKVKNKELIENELIVELEEDINNQVFYESEYKRINAKSHSIENILTAIAQRLAGLKREQEMAKMV